MLPYWLLCCGKLNFGRGLAQGPALPMATVASELADLASALPEQPRLLLLRVASAVQHRDVTTALDSLHGFFDTTSAAHASGATGVRVVVVPHAANAHRVQACLPASLPHFVHLLQRH
jgi:hypothetical protein